MRMPADADELKRVIETFRVNFIVTLTGKPTLRALIFSDRPQNIH